MRRGDVRTAQRLLADFKAASPTATVAAPWLSVRILLVAAANHLALSDTACYQMDLHQADRLRSELREIGTDAHGFAEAVVPLPERL